MVIWFDADKYNVTITRMYSVTGHRKGLSFEVKNILRQRVVNNNRWFENTLDICSHLTARSAKE